MMAVDWAVPKLTYDKKTGSKKGSTEEKLKSKIQSYIMNIEFCSVTKIFVLYNNKASIHHNKKGRINLEVIPM